MPLYANGTLIPENVANALIVNGVNITQVIANGVEVWTQRLFNGVWSGSSFVGSSVGFSTSGSAYRASSSDIYGVWLYANSSGLASGTTTATKLITATFTTTPTSILSKNGSGYVYFAIGIGFTGSSLDGNGSGLKTSGSLMAFTYNIANSMSTGEWISLT